MKKVSAIEIIAATIGAFIAILICLPISKDGETYLHLFNELSLEKGMLRNTVVYEPLFWYWIKWVKLLGGNLSVALLPLVFLAILFKLNSFKMLGTNFFYISICYISIFYLLNEGTQLRVSVALGFALLSCSSVLQNKLITAAVFCAIAAGYHITSPLLPAVFFLCKNSRKFSLFSWFFLFLGILVFTIKLPIMDILIVRIARLLGGRYTDYIAPSREIKQNASGLMFYYAFSLTGLFLFLDSCRRYIPDKKVDVYLTCLSVCVYGNGLLFWFYTRVAVASRLSDILTIMIVPMLAIVIRQASPVLRYSSIVCLIIFFLLRLNYLF